MNEWPVLTQPELIELASSPYSFAPSPFEARPALLVESAASHDNLSPPEQQAVTAWLLRQACPVIAIGKHTADPWRDVYDVVVGHAEDAAALLANIQRAPLAAMVLVQTLRTTASLPPAQALTVESLAYATLQGGREFRAWSAANPPQPALATASEAPAVLLERNDDHLEIRLNRPAQRNALSVEMRDALVEALQLVIADASLASARVSGVGDCFSSGGELAEFGTTPDPASAHAIRSLRLPAALLTQCASRVEFHLHGACIGAGMEIPAFAQRVTAAPKTFFQLPEIRFGLIPGAGGCVSLPRRLGRQRTAWLALSARRINAATALEWGLVDALVEEGALS